MTRRRIITAVLIAGIGGLAGAGAEDQTELLPAYKFKVGQSLTYEGSQPGVVQMLKAQIWVVGRNANGGWHCIAHNQRGRRRTLLAFELDRRGWISSQVNKPVYDVVRDCFILLPPDLSTCRIMWEAFDEGQHEKHIYSYDSQSDPSEGRWVFDVKIINSAYKVWGREETRTVRFNAQEGRLEKVERRISYEGRSRVPSDGRFGLKSVETVDPESLKELSRDAQAYFEATRAYEDVLSSLPENVDSTDRKMGQAKDLLVSARGKIRHPVVLAEIDEALQQHEASLDYHKRWARQKSEILNQPSPKWEATDSEGASYSVAGLRGKVVVLDFWYRRCGWCIRAMPELKRVASHFAGRPVVVLGMNKDEDPADAEFVIETMGLDYPNLRAIGIPQKYGVRGYPTLVILDQQGIIRRVHVGYSPNLSDILIRDIERLLETQS